MSAVPGSAFQVMYAGPLVLHVAVPAVLRKLVCLAVNLLVDVPAVLRKLVYMLWLLSAM